MSQKREYDKITHTIESTFKNISDVIDVNTVIGKPIKSDNNDIIVPISKVTVGMLVGGGEYGKVTIFKKDSDLPYSAGNGAVISIKPCGFLIKDEGGYKILSVTNTPYEKLLDKAADIIGEFKNEN